MAATIKDNNDNAANNAAAADDVTIATTTTTSCTPNEFIDAFNKQRTVLAGFAHCTTIEELHIVRDGFILGLAKDLCPDQYKSVLILILKKQFASQQKQEQEQEQNVIHIPPETSSSETKTIEKGIEMIMECCQCHSKKWSWRQEYVMRTITATAMTPTSTIITVTTATTTTTTRMARIVKSVIKMILHLLL